MNFLYSISNASLILRIVRYFAISRLPLMFVTVLHFNEYWLINIKFSERLSEQDSRDFEAYLLELGVPHTPNDRIQGVLDSLEQGQTPLEVMRKYQVAVVAHGDPNLEEIDDFRQSFIQGLGYCPPAFA